MSYELSQNGNVFFRGWEDPAVIQERLKRVGELKADLEMVSGQAESFANIIEKLSAELERVKAERDQLVVNFQNAADTMNDIYEQKLEVQAELTSLKSRLPKNADGDIVTPGDSQWIWRGGKTLPSDDPRIVYSIGEESVDFGSNGGYCHISSCFSTAESCRAAAEGGKG